MGKYIKKIYKKIFSNEIPHPISWRDFKYSMTAQHYHSYSDKDIKKLFTNLVNDLNK